MFFSYLSRFSRDDKLAVLVFSITLIAFVVESQLTQLTQTKLNYRQPYFLFYVVHSSFLISFPVHIAFLSIVTPHSPSAYWNGLKVAIAQHLTDDHSSTTPTKFPLTRCFYLIGACTFFITVPALLWFAALDFASVTDVTAIWNTNAFFAYIISVKVFGLKWEAQKIGAVLLATMGVLAVVYGGSTAPPPETTETASTQASAFSAPIMGDVMTLFGSILYALYQVVFKRYAAISDPEYESEYQHVPASDDPESDSISSRRQHVDPSIVSPPPFGLASNFWTSSIGLFTLIFLWWPIPLIHWFIEPFHFPSNLKTVGAIAGIALSGAMFNAGFMITLALWGPIITSVGGLLTIVLVFFSDVILGATESLTIWSVAGSATIVVAFGILAHDMLKQR